MTVVEDDRYQEMLARAADTLRKSGEVQTFDPEWLVRRGNYYTVITPEIAADLLDRNKNNRKPKRQAINKYMRDMRAGNWNPDASDIKVDRLGVLSDGQNRLMACVESGMPFPTLLRTGLDPEAKDHVDQNVRRTAGDTFKMHGIDRPGDVAAAVNLRVRYESLIREKNGRLVDAKALSQTNQEAIDFLTEHPSFAKYNKLACAMWPVGPSVARSVYIAAMSMFAETSEKLAREFAEKFIEGTVTGTGDPLLALSRYVATAQRHRQGNPGWRGKHVGLKHLLAMVRAWNAYVQSEQLPKIVVRDTDLLEPPV